VGVRSDEELNGNMAATENGFRMWNVSKSCQFGLLTDSGLVTAWNLWKKRERGLCASERVRCGANGGELQLWNFFHLISATKFLCD